MPPLPYTPTELLSDPDYQKGIATHFIAATNAYSKYFGQWKNVWLSEQLLFEAIASSYCDIYRLQVFRGIKSEDKHKRAAFLIKWLTKFRPIQLVGGGYTDLPADLLANEIFAVEVALIVLNIEPEDFFKDVRFAGYAKNIVYLLRNHSCGAEQIASELFLLEQIAK